MKRTVTVIAKSENIIILSTDKLAFSFPRKSFEEDIQLNKSDQVDIPESNYENAFLSQNDFINVELSMVKNDHV